MTHTPLTDPGATEQAAADAPPGPRFRTPRALLRWSVRVQAADVSLAVTGSLVRQVALLLTPFAIESALDDGLVPGDGATTMRWIGVIAVLAVVQYAGAVLWERSANLADARVGARLRSLLIRRIATLDSRAVRPGAIDPHGDGIGTGDLILRAGRDTDQIRVFVHGIPQWAVIALTVGFVLPAVAGLDPRLLLVALATVPLLVTVTLLFPPAFGRASAELSAAHGHRADAVEDLLTAGVAVRGLGGERDLVRRHHERSDAVVVANDRVARVGAWWEALGPAAPRLAIAVGVGVGGLAALSGEMTVGGIVAFASWMTTLTFAMIILIGRVMNRGEALAAAARILQVLDLRPSVADAAAPVDLPARGSLVLYRPGQPAPLLTIEPGEIVAVTGRTGSGKSTLLDILSRRVDPHAAVVEFAGVDLRAAPLAQVRARVAMVTQRASLPSGRLDEVLAGPGVPVEVLEAACRLAVVDDLIGHLPDGLQTELAADGNSVSGGQLARLALASALVGVLTGRTAVLLLDDITAALDVDTERRVLQSLRALGPEVAVVLATGRPAVLTGVDRVVAVSPAVAATPPWPTVVVPVVGTLDGDVTHDRAAATHG